MDHGVWYAFLLTTLAGCATGIGSALAYLTNRTRKGFLSMALGRIQAGQRAQMRSLLAPVIRAA